MYRIELHKLVLEKDLKKISKDEIAKIFKSIYKKLTVSPETFGKPLSSSLKGYYRLRVDQFRIVYSINKNTVTVFVLQIGQRKDAIVYLEAAKRLKNH